MRRAYSWAIVVAITLLSACWCSPAASQTVDWIRQLGTSSWDRSFAVSADGLGNVYISGKTGGDLGGPNAGQMDAWVARIIDVPEPSALVLAAVALVCFARWRRPCG